MLIRKLAIIIMKSNYSEDENLQKGLVVSKVLDGSIAKELEIVSGDRILEIDGTEVEDIIDFEYLCSDEEFIMYIEKTDGEIWELEIDKMPEEYLGIIVEEVSTNGLKVCKNNCIFCFVNQMPEGMRKSLYDKDDDYRLSATQGCYITLSNLSEEEFQRIERLHIGPLYISVHAWDPEVRKTLMINPATANISVQIQRLVKAGLTIHTQIVVVPGYNDGKVLKETVENLALLYPSVQSIGVVPVGLTKYRSGLPEIRPLDSEEAKNILEEGEKWQRYYRNTTGKNLVYFSDEFYVLSGKKFPRVIEYDDFYQIENGIGMASKFSEDINSIWSLIPKKITPRRVHIITGVSAANYFRFWKNKLSFIEGLSII
ncbi:MAG: DUF512 domain-containing protein, partial [Eubacteriales bacterium]